MYLNKLNLLNKLWEKKQIISKKFDFGLTQSIVCNSLSQQQHNNWLTQTSLICLKNNMCISTSYSESDPSCFQSNFSSKQQSFSSYSPHILSFSSQFLFFVSLITRSKESCKLLLVKWRSGFSIEFVSQFKEMKFEIQTWQFLNSDIWKNFLFHLWKGVWFCFQLRVLWKRKIRISHQFLFLCQKEENSTVSFILKQFVKNSFWIVVFQWEYYSLLLVLTKLLSQSERFWGLEMF